MFKMAERDNYLNNPSTNLLDRAFQQLHEADLRASVLESPTDLADRDGLVRVDSPTGGQIYELQIKRRRARRPTATRFEHSAPAARKFCSRY